MHSPAPTYEEQVRDSIVFALNEVKWKVPDGRKKSVVYTKLQEALLWLESDPILEGLD